MAVSIMQLCLVILVVTISFNEGSPKAVGRRLSLTPFPRVGRMGKQFYGLHPQIRTGRSGDLPWNSGLIAQPRVGRAGALSWDTVPDCSIFQQFPDSSEYGDTNEDDEVKN